MAERVRVPGGRVTGKLLQWKGAYGWIQPNTTVNHPEASRRGGKIYLAQEDLETPNLSTGDTVNFFVYADGSGLGAQHCKVATGAGGTKGIAKAVAPKVQYAQRAAKGAGKGTVGGLTKVVQQKYVAVTKGQAATKKGPKLQPTAKSMPSPEGMKGGGTTANRRQGEPGVSQVPNKSGRQRLTERISGTLHRWKNDIGWIKPDNKLEGIKKNQIYVHRIDFKQGDEALVGTPVTFFVYQDEAGTGAEHVITHTGAATVNLGVGRTAAKKPVFAPTTFVNKNLLPQPKMKGQSHVQGKLMPKLTMVQKTKKSRGKKNKGGGEKKERPNADLPRTRITDVTVSGEVVEWKGKYGWVKATDAVEHEKAGIREGKLYVNAKDIVGGDELSAGQAVEFHVYEDSSGLGAEECVGV